MVLSCFAVVQGAQATTVLRTHSCLPTKAGTAGSWSKLSNCPSAPVPEELTELWEKYKVEAEAVSCFVQAFSLDMLLNWLDILQWIIY